MTVTIGLTAGGSTVNPVLCFQLGAQASDRSEVLELVDVGREWADVGVGTAAAVSRRVALIVDNLADADEVLAMTGQGVTLTDTGVSPSLSIAGRLTSCSYDWSGAGTTYECRVEIET